MDIYAALNVPEVWRYDGQTIHVMALRGGQYVEVGASQVLPQFPIEQAIARLQERTTIGETELIRQFQSWVRQHCRA